VENIKKTDKLVKIVNNKSDKDPKASGETKAAAQFANIHFHD